MIFTPIASIEYQIKLLGSSSAELNTGRKLKTEEDVRKYFDNVVSLESRQPELPMFQSD